MDINNTITEEDIELVVPTNVTVSNILDKLLVSIQIMIFQRHSVQIDKGLSFFFMLRYCDFSLLSYSKPENRIT